MSPDVIASSGITTQPARRAVLTEALELPGELVADPDTSAKVAVVVTGRISKVSFKEGAHVKQGDELVVIDVPEVGRLAGELATAQTRAKAARTNASRVATLADKGLAAKQEVTNADAEADALESASTALNGQLRALGAHADSASRLTIRAPISGIVLSRNAVVGQPVGANEIVATIAELTHVWFAARVFEKDLGNVREGAKLRVAPVDSRGEVILEEYERLLGPRTRIVAITQVSNALGTIVPVQEMTAMAHRAGARVLVDGAQSVAHMPVDVQAIDCDFFAFSGHKIFGPTGIGVLYGKKDVLAAMPPWQGGGNMIADVTFEKTAYQPPPWRFEAGTGNIADAVGLGAALEYSPGSAFRT